MVKFCSRPGALTGGWPELLPPASITVSKGLRGHGFEIILPRPVDRGELVDQINQRLEKDLDIEQRQSWLRGSLEFWVPRRPDKVLGDDTKGQISGKATAK
jgi:hypothetical protein